MVLIAEENTETKITQELIKRYAKLLDLVIDAVINVPSRPGMVLEADLRRLRFAASALGIEISKNVEETAGKIVHEALRRIEELRPGIELFMTFPEYGHKREEIPQKGNKTSAEGMKA